MLIASMAIHRPVAIGLERHLRFLTAFSTDDGKHLPGSLFPKIPRVFAGAAAIAATLRFIFETLFRIKFLFTLGENKGSAAVFTYEFSVFKGHERYSPYLNNVTSFCWSTSIISSFSRRYKSFFYFWPQNIFYFFKMLWRRKVCSFQLVSSSAAISSFFIVFLYPALSDTIASV